MNIAITPSNFFGKIYSPPSKSLSHRAIICAGLAQGASEISNLTLSGDIEASIGAMRQLGACIDLKSMGGCLYNAIISGGIAPQNVKIDCGESGSTLRFILPVALALSGSVELYGRGRLGQRPLGVFRNLCESQGILWNAAEEGFPLAVRGRLFPGKYIVPGNVSSQFITGLLMALPLLGGRSILKTTGTLESRPYVDLTIDILKKHGIKFKEASPGLFAIPGMQLYKPCSYTIEGDWSQAAFLIALGARGGIIEINGLNPDSEQGDRQILELFSRMGGNFKWQNDSLVIERSKLTGTRIDLSDFPDLAPPVAAMCAAAQGESMLIGIERLRLKESDRVESIAACIKSLGGNVRVQEHSISITGGSLAGGLVDSFGDHRIAMMAAALSPACSGKIEIKGAESVNKSWPAFWDDFRTLGGVMN